MAFFPMNFHVVVQAFLQVRVILRYQRSLRQAIKHYKYKEGKEAKHSAQFQQARYGEPHRKAQGVSGRFSSVFRPFGAVVRQSFH